VPENKNQNPKPYWLRAKIPMVFRVAAVGAILTAVIVVVIGFYRERSKAAFKLRSEHTQLSTDVVSEVHGYERLETDDGYSDGHESQPLHDGAARALGEPVADEDPRQASGQHGG